MIESLIRELEKRLGSKLPGRDAQYRMAPSLRPPGNAGNDGSRSKPSGVLILLFPGDDGISTVFIERAQGGPHGGQVSLPGGKREKGDTDLTFTAMREASEEIGINPEEVELLGLLTPLYVPHSNYCIQPVIGYCQEKPSFESNPVEVDEIVVVSLESLFSPENRRIMNYKWGGSTIEAPYYDAGGHMVWGATAMIISEFEILFTSCISG
jgi:8-oxo-dGTP pyrophosphatase MutT (NUDIX family)